MLEIVPGLMIWTLITFVVLLLVLKKFAFGPIQNMIDNRRNAIAESIEAAENTRREAERLLAEYRESIANAKREAEEIIERAHKVGESTKNDIVNEARDLA
ncbi:MAG TPA: ATP synthase F0 subunit B [Actinobacteria bacterium]|nr:ATP synthase F0 subunit B [Actinomycetota bacterium]